MIIFNKKEEKAYIADRVKYLDTLNGDALSREIDGAFSRQGKLCRIWAAGTVLFVVVASSLFAGAMLSLKF